MEKLSYKQIVVLLENMNKLKESSSDGKQRTDERITRLKDQKVVNQWPFKYGSPAGLQGESGIRVRHCDQYLSGFLAFVYLIHYQRPSEPAAQKKGRMIAGGCMSRRHAHRTRRPHSRVGTHACVSLLMKSHNPQNIPHWKGILLLPVPKTSSYSQNVNHQKQINQKS